MIANLTLRASYAPTVAAAAGAAVVRLAARLSIALRISFSQV